MAVRLAEGLARDGWRVGWSRRADGSWEASVGSPSMPVPVGTRGLTRVSAISAAHLEAIRRAGLAAPGPARLADPGLHRFLPVDELQSENGNRKSEFMDMKDLFDLA
jgi:hypothetical protein